MTLDLYVGGLSRYFSANWKTLLQLHSEEQGTVCRVVRPADPFGFGPVSDPISIREQVLAWKEQTNRVLAEAGLGTVLEWEESPAGEYFTDMPNHEGMRALRLWAWSSEHPDLPRPVRMPAEDDPALPGNDDPAFLSAYPNLITDLDLWLPVPFDPSVIQMPGPHGREVLCGSSLDLLRELNGLNAATWSASRAGILAWRTQGPPDPGDLEAQARFGFACIFFLAELAVQHRLPLVVDR